MYKITFRNAFNGYNIKGENKEELIKRALKEIYAPSEMYKYNAGTDRWDLIGKFQKKSK